VPVKRLREVGNLPGVFYIVPVLSRTLSFHPLSLRALKDGTDFTTRYGLAPQPPLNRACQSKAHEP
jgi:hypothetical protein